MTGHIGFSRYVALGDSQTEGLWDGDDAGGLRGFADRLAERLDVLSPGLQYANLAVRGNQIRDVADVQLPAALAMDADLITLCIGMNDMTRPGSGFEQALTQLREVHRALAASGATVVTTTFPDLARILPIGRVLGARVLAINEVIRTASQRHGFALVDLYEAPSMTQPDTWSPDRVHGSPRGHHLFAEAAAEALGLPGSSHHWATADPTAAPPSLRSRTYSQLLWTQNMLMPYLWNHLRGHSVSATRGPRRPALAQLVG
ncbi:MAG: SGNH/GDSL hydrolase family protein [Mycobacterium kyogaense]|uniref:SGNH/GDSL hydrolase family protein n=1 Tax=Mycobacterium kyogaense TaxID=2212479 RepID=UPI002FF43FED